MWLSHDCHTLVTWFVMLSIVHRTRIHSIAVQQRIMKIHCMENSWNFSPRINSQVFFLCLLYYVRVWCFVYNHISPFRITNTIFVCTMWSNIILESSSRLSELEACVHLDQSKNNNVAPSPARSSFLILHATVKSWEHAMLRERERAWGRSSC